MNLSQVKIFHYWSISYGLHLIALRNDEQAHILPHSHYQMNLSLYNPRRIINFHQFSHSEAIFVETVSVNYLKLRQMWLVFHRNQQYSDFLAQVSQIKLIKFQFWQLH